MCWICPERSGNNLPVTGFLNRRFFFVLLSSVTMSAPHTLLFAVEDYIARAGLPPKDAQDSFDAQSTIVGNLLFVSKIVFNPDGELFAVRGEELYRGPMPSNLSLDWFSSAKRVGKTDWDKFKFLLFDPQGNLYAVTKKGELYEGPAPSNEGVPWIYGEATKVGTSGWNRYDSLFFDSKGNLYGVTDDKLVMRSLTTNSADWWPYSNTTIGKGGWRGLSHFMAIGPDDALWCVDSQNGNLYKGPIPTKEDTNYLDTAVKLGWGYNAYRLMSFTVDKIMGSVMSCEFLPESGKIVSLIPELVQTQTYVNPSSSPVTHMFTFTKTLLETSTFSQDHGFTVPSGVEMTFTAVVPFIVGPEEMLTLDRSALRTWHFTKENHIPVQKRCSGDPVHFMKSPDQTRCMKVSWIRAKSLIQWSRSPPPQRWRCQLE
uniref:Tachylectin 2 domain-containing protein n=1 Tax=Leptobrachium leishanense TaxID=445787 RepID=A0A8C5PI55_9ANUR